MGKASKVETIQDIIADREAIRADRDQWREKALRYESALNTNMTIAHTALLKQPKQQPIPAPIT